jgi:GTP cyclohydrolase I
MQENGNGTHALNRVTLATSEVGHVAAAVPESVGKFETEDRLQAIIAMLLAELGVDLTSQHFRETPRRVARFYREFTGGYRAKPLEILKTFRARSQELVVVSDIEFYSLCPHHLLIYGGKIHFGYIPDTHIVGVSKIPRLVQALAARPVVQEELVADIAEAFMAAVKPRGCAVRAIGKHDCVAARGVRCPEATMTTIALRGVFAEDSRTAEEFYRSVHEGSSCVR